MSFRATETDSRREPKTEGVRILIARVIIDGDGDWAITDDPSVTPDGWLVLNEDGSMAVEDSDPTDALTVRMTTTQTLAY